MMQTYECDVKMPKYLRQSSIINIEDFRDNEITIVGCGAIGSFVAVSLAKMGLTKFALVDFDTVEEHNLPNQFFEQSDVGKHKVTITSINMINFNNNVEINVVIPRFDKNTKIHTPIVISCVDKMNVRKMIFEASIKANSQLFIDTRMAGLQGQVYTVDLTDKKEIENYKKSLFKDKEAVQTRCTERSIIFTVLGIASLVCNQIVKAFNKEKLRNYIVIDYSVPQIM